VSPKLVRVVNRGNWSPVLAPLCCPEQFQLDSSLRNLCTPLRIQLIAIGKSGEKPENEFPNGFRLHESSGAILDLKVRVFVARA
jgi:hypothetical protein